ncbi:MAG: hypothetical protein HY820_42480 [Acidobacteria bacterium]|nr:hypothetical protein [Acidobacteriota bacterium]
MMLPLALAALSFVRVDIATDTVTARDWADDAPTETGSLLKPFIALAYAQSHQLRYPVVTCKRCWLPRGHGRVGIEQAIAQSCNTYFDSLRGQLRDGELEATARRFGITALPKVSPADLLRAYVELTRRAAEPGVSPLLEGMKRAASTGTAKEIGGNALAKTGTAPCSHRDRAPGDGFVIVLTPAVQPRTALIVRLHGRPGSHAAQAAAGLLR